MRPLPDYPGLLPCTHQGLESGIPNCKELGPMIEDAPAKPASRHPAAGSSGFFKQGDLVPGLAKGCPCDQTADAGPKNENVQF